MPYDAHVGGGDSRDRCVTGWCCARQHGGSMDIGKSELAIREHKNGAGILIRWADTEHEWAMKETGYGLVVPMMASTGAQEINDYMKTAISPVSELRFHGFIDAIFITYSSIHGAVSWMSMRTSSPGGSCYYCNIICLRDHWSAP